MSIRLRRKNRNYIALCGAKSYPKKRDIYLNDAIYDALAIKFLREFKRLFKIK